MIHTKSGLHLDMLTTKHILLEDVIWGLCHMSARHWHGQTAHMWTEGQHAMLIADMLVSAFAFQPSTAAAVALCNAPLAYGLEPVKQGAEPEPSALLVYNAMGVEKWWAFDAPWQGIEKAKEKEYNELVACTHVGTLPMMHARTVYQQFHKMVKTLLKPKRS